MEIEGYPNYLIYDDGRVWSIPRKNARVGRYMRQGHNTQGYLIVVLRYQGQAKTFAPHRLVAEHYIPNHENKPTVDHIDRNIANNHVSNLRWATNLEQAANRGMLKTNKSGHEHIVDRKIKYKKSVYQYWKFTKARKGHKTINRQFKSKIDAICYKYIALLKIKAGVI